MVLGSEPAMDQPQRSNMPMHPKSLEHILAGTYPLEQDTGVGNGSFSASFVQLWRDRSSSASHSGLQPDICAGHWFRDWRRFHPIEYFAEREREQEAIQYIIDQINPLKVVSSARSGTHRRRGRDVVEGLCFCWDL